MCKSTEVREHKKILKFGLTRTQSSKVAGKVAESHITKHMVKEAIVKHLVFILKAMGSHSKFQAGEWYQFSYSSL